MRRRFMTNSDPIPYMYIEALNDNTQISFSNNSYQYKVGDDAEWLKIKDYPIPTVSSGEKVYFKGVLLSLMDGVGQFTVDKEYKVGGDLRTLIYGDNVKKSSPLLSWCFNFLFAGSPIKEIDKDSLPATTLADACYTRMFYNCTNLRNAPTLPATTLTDSCYYKMFYDCSSLTTAPALPATTLAYDCYYGMFSGCTSLTTAPTVLPATTLAINCYRYMFNGCTSLTTAPELPATTLASNCYQSMFQGCTNLNYIKMLATDTSVTYCLSNWVKGVASTGTFVKNPNMTTLPTGMHGIPSGWIIVNDGEDSGGSVMPIVLNAANSSMGNYTTPPSDNPNAKKLYEELMLLSNNTGEGNLDVGLVTLYLTHPGITEGVEKYCDVTSYSLAPSYIAEGILLYKDGYSYYVLQQDGTIKSVFYD